MEASQSFEAPDEQVDKQPVSPEAVARGLGATTAIAEVVSDEGDGGGHDWTKDYSSDPKFVGTC